MWRFTLTHCFGKDGEFVFLVDDYRYAMTHSWGWILSVRGSHPDHWIQLTPKDRVLKSPDCPPVVRSALVYSSHCSGFGLALTASWYDFWIFNPKKEDLDDGKLRPIKQSHLPTLCSFRGVRRNSGRHFKNPEISIFGKLETTPTSTGVFGPVVSGP